MDRALFCVNGCYNIPNVSTTGRMCRTNMPSNTAFRGFGGPQAMVVAETFVLHVASRLGMAPHRVSGMQGGKCHCYCLKVAGRVAGVAVTV